MADQIQRNSIAFPLETRYNNASSAPTPGSDPKDSRRMVPPINTVPSDYPLGPAPNKIEKLYDANNQKILTRLSAKTDYANSLLRFGPRQPFLWYNPNEGNSGLNAVKKYDSRFFPLGSALQDVIRVSKFTVSGNGIAFLFKQVILQNLQPFNETTLYNPAMPILSAVRPTTLGLLPRTTRYIDLSGGLLGALASVVGFSVNNGKSSPKGTVGAGINDTADNSPLSKQAVGGGKGLIRGKTASSGYTSLASRWGGNANKNSFLKSMAASVFPSLISSKQPDKTGYRGDEGAYGMMISDLKGKFAKNHVITGAEIQLTQLWIAGSSDGGPKNIRKNGNEAPQNRKIKFIDGSEQKISGTDVSGPSINGGSTGFALQKDVDNVEKYGKSVGIEAYRKDSASNFKHSIMLMNYKKFLDKTSTFQTKMDVAPVDLTNADDPIILRPQEAFYKKYGFDSVPTVFEVKPFTSIPTRQGSGDEKRAAYNVDGTYSKNRKDEGGNGVLSEFKKNLQDGKFLNVPSSVNDIGEPINATLQQKQDDRIVKDITDNKKKIYTNLGLTDTPDTAKLKTIDQIPERGSDPTRPAYTVDGTYSKNRQNFILNDNANGVLAEILTKVEDGKSKNLATETTDLAGSPDERISATLQNKKEDPINSRRVESLNKLVEKIKNTGYSVVFADADTRVFTSPDTTLFGLNKLKKVNVDNKKLTDNYKDNTQLLDGLTHDRRSSKKMAGSNKGDGLNRLTILNKDRSIEDETDISGWNTYEPYNDDLIAFYFYDIVNEKHIPFRASVIGINDSFQAEWPSYKYIGRADKLYTYDGITRQLSFSFKVIANSVKELLPMWKRINYLCGLTMPANYTSVPSDSDDSTSQFAVPPLVLLTLGDMYKEQPILINRVGLSIPESAAWETVHENAEQDWSYLNNIITWTGSKGKVAQFPREVDISVDLTPLFKERPVTGMANFGHAPRDITNSELIAGTNNKFSQGLIVSSRNVEREQ